MRLIGQYRVLVLPMALLAVAGISVVVASAVPSPTSHSDPRNRHSNTQGADLAAAPRGTAAWEQWASARAPDYVASMLAGRASPEMLDGVRNRLLREESDEAAFAGLTCLTRAFDPQMRATSALHLAWGYRVAFEAGYPVEEAVRALWRDREIRTRRTSILGLRHHDSPLAREALLAGLADNGVDVFAGPGDRTIAKECADLIAAMYSNVGGSGAPGTGPAFHGWVPREPSASSPLHVGELLPGESLTIETPELGAGYHVVVALHGLGTSASSLGTFAHDTIECAVSIRTPLGELVGEFGSEVLPALAPISYDNGGIRAQSYFRVTKGGQVRFWVAVSRVHS